MKELKKIMTFVEGFIILNLLWYLLAIIINSKIVPNPHEIYLNLPSLLENNFYMHITFLYTKLYKRFQMIHTQLHDQFFLIHLI